MISKYEFYHGAVLSRLVDSGEVVTIMKFSNKNNASYIINKSIGLYIKYCEKRLSPWRFTFRKEHQDEIKTMAETLSKVFVALVCNDDGICCLNFKELKLILDESHDDEWISAARLKREKYKVKGSDGNLQFKIADSHFPERLFKELTVTPIELENNIV